VHNVYAVSVQTSRNPRKSTLADKKASWFQQWEPIFLWGTVWGTRWGDQEYFKDKNDKISG